MIQLLTFAQAAEFCCCSVKTLKRAKNLKVVRLGKSAKSDRIHPRDLTEYIEQERGLH